MNGHQHNRAARAEQRARAALRRRERRRLLSAWLRPGIGVKRWLAVAFLGQLLIAVAVALMVGGIAIGRPAGDETRGVVETLALLAVGAALLGYGGWRLLRALIEPYRRREEPLAELLYQRRVRARGPHVVAIGGGTGLSTLLRGLKHLTSNITAVVTVADDGGSSGKLRAELGMPAMGDIRNCIAALADAEPVMSSLLQYRFPVAAGDENGFAGHAFGNLLIAALTSVTGDFEEGVRQSNRVLAVRGSVVPVAGKPITLHAELGDGTTLEGQSVIARARDVRRVSITPEEVKPSAEALAAIASADIVVIGPGSLFTSLLPPLLVPGMHAALAQTRAMRLFVCNVATQVGETEEFALSQHLEALVTHGLADIVDAVLINNNFKARQPVNYPAAAVRIDLPLSSAEGPLIAARDVVDDDNAHHHDAHKLAAAIFGLYDDRPARRPAGRTMKMAS